MVRQEGAGLVGVTWTRLSDDFCDRPDLLGCSRSARLLYVELLVYANRLELDGRIPVSRLPRFTDAGEEELSELVAADLAFITAADIIVVDWSDQEPAERVQLRRHRNAARQRKFRDRQERCKSGDHSDCSPEHCPALRNGVTDGVSNSAPTRPVPSRKGQGQEGRAGAGGAAPACPECGIGGGNHAADCEAA